jgi:LuxR family maltose regulon positive regulatory protein
VAEYLVAEVLERQSERVRRLLLVTSVLDRVNGELADLLAGGSGGERVLQELEEANAFVVSLDAARSWFRYHRLFADLLRLELRRAAPGEVAGLHAAAAGWLADRGFAVEAIRHAQAAGDWEMAVWLLAGHWPGLLWAGRPAPRMSCWPGSRPGSPRRMRSWRRWRPPMSWRGVAGGGGAVPGGGRAGVGVGAGRPARAGAGAARGGPAVAGPPAGDLPAVAAEARRLQALAEAPDAAQPGLGEYLRALALISLGITEFGAGLVEEAEPHLEQGAALARRIGRPFLEFSGLAYEAALEITRSFALSAERGRQAVELARQHGWTDEPAAGIAYMALGAVLALQGRPGEAEPWIQRAERTVKAEAEPAAALLVRYVRGLVELGRGCDREALAAFQAADRMAGRLAAPHLLIPRVQGLLLLTLVRLGETERAGQALAGLGELGRQRGEIRIATAALRLAQDDPHAASAALEPVLDGSAPVPRSIWLPQAFVLEAIARDALGDPAAAGRALERALDLAEPDGALWTFLLHSAPGLLERHARHRTAHASLLMEVRSLLAGRTPAPASGPQRLLEPLRDSELRVLCYLPSDLTVPEIAAELYVSPNTVKTHMRNLYAKLGTHRRHEAVERARALGLLAPSTRPR